MYRRVSKVVWLQWRGIAIVVIILVDVIFFSVVFIYLNDVTTHAMDDLDKALPFLECLLDNPLEHEVCSALGEALFVSKSTVVAILIMLSLAGIQVFLLLFRTTMVTAWIDLFRTQFGQKREFVSLDAKHEAHVEAQQYELSKFPGSPISVPPSAIASPASNDDFDMHSRSYSQDYFKEDIEREYSPPKHSFSAPLSPTHRAPDWDPQSTHARGGLGLHPPVIEEEERHRDRF